MRFLIDMMLSPGLASWLRSEGHDAVHASTLGLAQAPDTAIVDHARRDQRVIVTGDLDYPRLLAIAGGGRPGLILFRGGAYKEAQIRTSLAAVFQTIPPEELSDSIVVVEPTRIRRRRLPIGDR